MSGTPAWFDEVDFAFLGEDNVGRIALFFVQGVRAAVPEELLRELSQEDYNRVTAFLIDELLPTTEAIVEAGHEWARQDAVKGIFVYTLRKGTFEFVRVARPVTPVLRKDIAGLGPTKLVLKLAALDFEHDVKCLLPKAG